ncbi:hypothetical protein evm_008855 [Chilo suppressalis]|nr:hypothetical protein evm_008855 [Chilo suppressalis]
MELMSSAFLCALVALLPQMLVKARNKNTLVSDVKFNNSLAIGRNSTLRKALLLNINGPPLVSNLSEIQSVYNDVTCKSCIVCMDRAIRAHSLHVHMSSNRPNAAQLRDDVLSKEINKRVKRETKTASEPAVDRSTKKSKGKKNKQQKAVTVTKYEVDSVVYALKVKETLVSNEQQSDKIVGTCQVYSVKKSFPCGSPDGEAVLQAAKRKANRKKSKKEQDKNIVTSTTVTSQISIFKKREVDSTQVLENIMPSIEDNTSIVEG